MPNGVGAGASTTFFAFERATSSMFGEEALI